MQPENKSAPTAIEILQAMEELTLPVTDETDAQTTEELERYLANHGVSIEPRSDDLKKRLEAARNKLGLAVAREERLRTPGENWLTQAARTPLLAGKALRDEVQRRLSKLGPQAAAVYARDFQEGDDDDLRTILAALDRLEAAESNKGDEDGQV